MSVTEHVEDDVHDNEGEDEVQRYASRIVAGWTPSEETIKNIRAIIRERRRQAK